MKISALMQHSTVLGFIFAHLIWVDASDTREHKAYHQRAEIESIPHVASNLHRESKRRQLSGIKEFAYDTRKQLRQRNINIEPSAMSPAIKSTPSISSIFGKPVLQRHNNFMFSRHRHHQSIERTTSNSINVSKSNSRQQKSGEQNSITTVPLVDYAGNTSPQSIDLVPEIKPTEDYASRSRILTSQSIPADVHNSRTKTLIDSTVQSSVAESSTESDRVLEPDQQTYSSTTLPSITQSSHISFSRSHSSDNINHSRKLSKGIVKITTSGDRSTPPSSDVAIHSSAASKRHFDSTPGVTTDSIISENTDNFVATSAPLSNNSNESEIIITPVEKPTKPTVSDTGTGQSVVNISFTHQSKQFESQTTSPQNNIQNTPPLETSQNTLQNTYPQTISPQNTYPQNTYPQNTYPQNTYPQNTYPQNTSPQNTSPQNTSPQNTSPQNTSSQNTSTQNTSPKIISPHMISPQNTPPQRTSPQTAPLSRPTINGNTFVKTSPNQNYGTPISTSTTTQPKILGTTKTKRGSMLASFLGGFNLMNIIGKRLRKSERSRIPTSTPSSDPTSTKHFIGNKRSDIISPPVDPGFMCYAGDSLKFQEVPCPGKRVRRSALDSHHLDRLLRSLGGTTNYAKVASFEHETNEEFHDFQQHDEGYQQNVAQVLAMTQEHISLNTNLRNYVRAYLRLPASKDVVSLTHFLKRIINTSDECSSCMSPTHPTATQNGESVCAINSIDIGEINTLQEELDNEIYNPLESFSGLDANESIMQMAVHEGSSQKLMDLILKLQTAIANFSTVVTNVRIKLEAIQFSPSHLNDQNTKHSIRNSADTDTFPPKGLEESVISSSSSPLPFPERRGLHSKSLSNSAIKIGRRTRPSRRNHRQSDDLEFKGINHLNLKRDSLPKSECDKYNKFISDILESIDEKLIALEDALQKYHHMSLNFHQIRQKTSQAAHNMDEMNKLRRIRRTANGRDQPLCRERGSRIDGSDYLSLCSVCEIRSHLDQVYFPRIFNEKICGKSSDQTNEVNEGCLNESSPDNPVAGGRCQQQKIQMLILKRVPDRCVKMVINGKEIITDKWELAPYNLRTGCQCEVNKNSKFAKLVKFP